MKDVCRICLATKVKMFDLKKDPLKTCIRTLKVLNNDKYLPTSVCYICSTLLTKCCKLIENAQKSKVSLQNIYSKHKIKMSNSIKASKYRAMIKDINKSEGNLTINLKTIELPNMSIVYEDCHEINQSPLKGTFTTIQSSIIQTKIDLDNTHNDFKVGRVYTQKLKRKYDYNDDFSDDKKSKDGDWCNDSGNVQNKIDLDNTNNDFKVEEVYTQELGEYEYNDDFSDDKASGDHYWCKDSGDKSSTAKVDENNDIDEIVNDDDLDDIPLSAMKMDCDFETKETEVQRIKKPKNGIQGRKRKKTIVNSEGLTEEEVALKQYFDIMVLSLEEQIDERQKMKDSATYRDALYRCELCYRTYLHPQAHQTHLQAHRPSQGEWECPVCKLRFKTQPAMMSHSDKSHGKKYCCKSCPKTFTKLELATKHSKRHTGYMFKCSICQHRAVNKSDLSNHLRCTHSLGGSLCTRCGQTFANFRGLKLHTLRLHHVRLSNEDQKEVFECRKCDLQFPSEEAWTAHNGVPDLHDDNCMCSVCGEPFPSQAELNKHSRLVHGEEGKWTLAGDTYPTECDSCGITLNNRKEHYFHVRRVHPKEREKYQPVITAVCDTCGKGFQNATKLHLHELRHKGQASVQCPHCPRLFYDKFHLARHIGVHSDERPFACTQCDKTFKLRSNLDRHARVHSDVTNYECSLCSKRFRYSSSRNLHIKTVHYKMPQPPRKRKPNKHNITDAYSNPTRID